MRARFSARRALRTTSSHRSSSRRGFVISATPAVLPPRKNRVVVTGLFTMDNLSTRPPPERRRQRARAPVADGAPVGGVPHDRRGEAAMKKQAHREQRQELLRGARGVGGSPGARPEEDHRRGLSPQDGEGQDHQGRAGETDGDEPVSARRDPERGGGWTHPHEHHAYLRGARVAARISGSPRQGRRDEREQWPPRPATWWDFGPSLSAIRSGWTQRHSAATCVASSSTAVEWVVKLAS